MLFFGHLVAGIWSNRSFCLVCCRQGHQAAKGPSSDQSKLMRGSKVFKYHSYSTASLVFTLALVMIYVYIPRAFIDRVRRFNRVEFNTQCICVRVWLRNVIRPIVGHGGFADSLRRFLFIKITLPACMNGSFDDLWNKCSKQEGDERSNIRFSSQVGWNSGGPTTRAVHARLCLYMKESSVINS